MLILTRKTGEALQIGADVSVTVLGVKGNQVRLGISAPREVGVYREEIYVRISSDLPGVTSVTPSATAILDQLNV